MNDSCVRTPYSPGWTPPAGPSPPAAPPLPRITGGCRWPVGIPPDDGPTYRFCDAPRCDGDNPYCAAHAAVAYMPRPQPQPPRVWKETDV